MRLSSSRINQFAITLLVIAFGASHGKAADLERIVWEYEPIEINVPVGKERRIEFPESVEVSLPQNVANRSDIKVLGEGVIYWRANKQFDKAQIEAITLSGYSYLLRVSSSSTTGSDHPLRIIDKRYPDKERPQPLQALDGKVKSYDYVAVQRMVAHEVLSRVPRRLASKLPGVQKIPIENTAQYLYRTGELLTTPVGQWKSPGVNAFYVTAVKMTNKMSYRVEFDPYMILGDFIASTPLHTSVDAQGTQNDTMIVLLLSKRSFMESIL